MKTSLVALLCLSSTSLMASEIACDYKSKVDTEFMGTISSSKNYNQKSFAYIDDTRICIVKMDIKIHNTWYPTEAEYIFGPDMTKTESGDLKQSPIVGGKLPEVSCKGSWTESAWKSVYSSVTKGCFPAGDNKKITLANGTTKWFYKEVCKTK